MQTSSKPTLGLMGSINIDYIQGKKLALQEEIKAHNEQMKRHALDKDIVQWQMVNEKKLKALQELQFIKDREQGYHDRQAKDKEAEEEKSKELRNASMKALFTENKKLRDSLQNIIKNLVNKFKEIEELNIKRIDEVTDVSEEERLAFTPESYYSDFFKVLNTHSEAQKFLQVASKMVYPPAYKIRKMKDFDYEQTNH
tara:strand:- start:661 stop:1254 length:594 start_codon:yes stop_codon:yes gene_type:complete